MHKSFIAYVHCVITEYMDGGPGPATKKEGKTPATESRVVREALMKLFVDNVKWNDVKAIGLYSSDREDGTGKGAFAEGAIMAVPPFLEPYVTFHPRNNLVEEGSDEE